MPFITTQLEPQENQSLYLSQTQWFKIFPEAREYLEQKLEDTKEKQDLVKQKARIEIERIEKRKFKGFTKYFLEKKCEVWYLLDIEKMERQITNLNWLLYPVKPKEGQITDEMIERAREYPLINVLGIPSNKRNIKCPFHKEKTASMNIKNNYYFCHGCGATGDSISLAMHLKGWTFPEAVKNLQ